MDEVSGGYDLFITHDVLSASDWRRDLKIRGQDAETLRQYVLHRANVVRVFYDETELAGHARDIIGSVLFWFRIVPAGSEVA